MTVAAAAAVTSGSSKVNNHTAWSVLRRWNSLFVIVASFVTGTFFGGGFIQFHGGLFFDLSFSGGDYNSRAYSDDPTTIGTAAAAATTTCACNDSGRDLSESEIEAVYDDVAPSATTVASKNNNNSKTVSTMPPALAVYQQKKSISTALQRIVTQKRMRGQKKKEVGNKYKTLRVPPPHSNWCPKARCMDTSLCTPCKRRYLILIATPRSASTTLTWMLDSLPGVRMSGENANTLGFLKKLVDNIEVHPMFTQASGLKSSWGHNPMPPQTLSCVSQKMIESINPPPLIKHKYLAVPQPILDKTIVGFKTIRFFSDTKTIDEERELTKFLIHHFPCSRIIVNINSDVEGQVKSINQYLSTGKNLKAIRYHITRENAKLRRLASRLGSQRALILDKDQWTKNVTNLNDAVSWLGFNESCHFAELMEFNTKGGYGNSKTKFNQKQNAMCQRL